MNNFKYSKRPHKAVFKMKFFKCSIQLPNELDSKENSFAPLGSTPCLREKSLC